ncbi:hypothetical protein [Streptomyces sp. NPDC093111]|uniref:hypothetical protein n=1 Tax=Streptomyces sp. NPDC093111 TaxID=3154978 RepID=UPI003429A94A
MKAKVSRTAEKVASVVTVWIPLVGAAFLALRNVFTAAWTADGWAAPVALLLAGLVFQRLDLVQKQQKSTEEKVDAIIASASSVTHYKNGREFYGALRTALKDTTDEVRSSYFRRVPPGNEKAAKDYFKACVAWANGGSDRALLRVMAEPQTDAMRAWVEDQREQAKSVRNGKYLLHSIQLHDTRAVSQVDALSIAVLDEKTVFCAFTTDDETVRGFSVTSGDLGGYFALYHKKLFEGGKKIF